MQPDAEVRKEFARDQVNFLRMKGINNGLRLSRIFKAAGPGQVQEAWELANCADWRGRVGGARRDLLTCILTYDRDLLVFDINTMRDIFRVAGFYVPRASNDAAFRRILDGALEILCPDSYPFTPEELQKIYAYGKDEDTEGDDIPLYVEENADEAEEKD